MKGFENLTQPRYPTVDLFAYFCPQDRYARLEQFVPGVSMSRAKTLVFPNETVPLPRRNSQGRKNRKLHSLAPHFFSRFAILTCSLVRA
jgi:hypothetical protein